MDLGDRTLSEMSPSHKTNPVGPQFYEVSKALSLRDTEDRGVVARDWGQGAGELVPLGERVSLLQEENNPRDLLYNSVNPLNTTELHLKTGKTVNLTSL